jgi:hypothetical protein
MMLNATRAVWGATLLLAPDRVLALIGDCAIGVERMTRVLGARHLAEAVTLIAASETGGAPRWPIAIDAVHGVSMLGVAALAPRHRRPALASAGIAGGLVAWAELERHRARR